MFTYSKMQSVKYTEAPHSHYAVTYYTSVLWTRARQLMLQYQTEEIFDANEVIPGLYIGSLEAVYAKKELEKQGITHVVAVLAGFQPPFPESFEYLVIGAMDSVCTELNKTFEEINGFIQECFALDGKVLVICMAGRSRSATAVCAYIMKTLGVSPIKAINLLQRGRNIVDPNPAFKQQLAEYFKYNGMDLSEHE